MTSTFGSQNIGFKEIKDELNIDDIVVQNQVLWDTNSFYKLEYDQLNDKITALETTWSSHASSTNYIIPNSKYNW